VYSQPTAVLGVCSLSEGGGKVSAAAVAVSLSQEKMCCSFTLIVQKHENGPRRCGLFSQLRTEL